MADESSKAIDAALADQMRTHNLMSQILTACKSAAATPFEPVGIEARLALLESYWSTFSERDYMLSRHSEALSARSYFKKNIYNEAQIAYLTAKAGFNAKLLALRGTSNRTSSGAATSPSASTHSAIEKVKLPRFDGKQQNWESFKEKFTALIRNDASIDPVIKLQHLANCLDGEVAEILASFDGTGANFESAWEALCQRYDNEYLRFTVQMKALTHMPAAQKESVSHISLLLNTVNQSINSFRSLGRSVDTWDDIFIYHVWSKLAPRTRMDWAREVETKQLSNFPSFSSMKSFLSDRIRTLDMVETDVADPAGRSLYKPSTLYKSSVVKDQKKMDTRKHSKSASINVATKKATKTTTRFKCSFCNGDHSLGYCQKFASCSQDQRKEHVVSSNLCLNCLKPNHSVENCQSDGRCLVCSQKHHTRLHADITVGSSTPSIVRSAHFAASTSNCCTMSGGRAALLATACITLQAPNGQEITVRALLDSGAEESFISEHVAQALALRKRPRDVVVSGIGGSTAAIANSSVEVILKAKHSPNFSLHFSALVLRRLTAVVPNAEVSFQSWPEIESLHLADPYFHTPRRIDCILNAGVYAAVIRPGIKRGPPGTYTALQTVFG